MNYFSLDTIKIDYPKNNLGATKYFFDFKMFI